MFEGFKPEYWIRGLGGTVLAHFFTPVPSFYVFDLQELRHVRAPI
jgi:ABC-type Fe3+ transport system permease subunit